MACVTSRSRCLASWYSFRGSLTLKSARSLSASILKKTALLPQKGADQGSSRTRRPEQASKPVFFQLACCPKKELEQGSSRTRRHAQLLVLRPPLGLPGFHLAQPGLEALPSGGARQVLPLCSCKVVRGEAQPQVLVHVRALVLLGLHGVKELAPPRRPRPSPSSPGCPTNS